MATPASVRRILRLKPALTDSCLHAISSGLVRIMFYQRGGPLSGEMAADVSELILFLLQAGNWRRSDSRLT